MGGYLGGGGASATSESLAAPIAEEDAESQSDSEDDDNTRTRTDGGDGDDAEDGAIAEGKRTNASDAPGSSVINAEQKVGASESGSSFEERKSANLQVSSFIHRQLHGKGSDRSETFGADESSQPASFASMEGFRTDNSSFGGSAAGSF